MNSNTFLKLLYSSVTQANNN